MLQPSAQLQREHRVTLCRGPKLHLQDGTALAQAVLQMKTCKDTCLQLPETSSLRNPLGPVNSPTTLLLVHRPCTSIPQTSPNLRKGRFGQIPSHLNGWKSQPVIQMMSAPTQEIPMRLKPGLSWPPLFYSFSTRAPAQNKGPFLHRKWKN